VITPEQIEEWIREAEERPLSSSNVIRYLANRLRELTSRNEELLAENIALRSGRKVEEYEDRIARLEYQAELLRRQSSSPIEALQVSLSTFSLILATPKGRVLRAELNPAELISQNTIASFPKGLPQVEKQVIMLVCSSQEELLFVFDSGRAVVMPVASLPSATKDALDWDQAFTQEPRGSEELVTILPIARMSLFDFAIQTSRRGFVKKIKESFLEACIANAYVGTGVVLPADRTFDLTMCAKDDLLVMASKEGYLLSIDVNRLPFTIEDTFRLGQSDHVVSTFTVQKKPSILAITQTGKVLYREAGWLEPALTLKAQGQALISQSRREAGIRLVGAAAVDEDDWGVILTTDGNFTLYKVSDTLGAGAVALASPQSEVHALTVFRG